MVIWVSSHGYGNNIQKAGRQCCAHQEVKFWPDPGNHCLNVQGDDTVIQEDWVIPQRLPKPNPLNSLWFKVLYNLPRTDFIPTSDSPPLWNISHRPYYGPYLKLTMHLKTHTPSNDCHFGLEERQAQASVCLLCISWCKEKPAPSRKHHKALYDDSSCTSEEKWIH